SDIGLAIVQRIASANRSQSDAIRAHPTTGRPSRKSPEVWPHTETGFDSPPGTGITTHSRLPSVPTRPNDTSTVAHGHHGRAVPASSANAQAAPSTEG